MTASYSVYFAFHRGEQKPLFKKIISSVIKLFTRGEFSHVELIFPNSLFVTNAFSSSGMDKPSGVRFKQIQFSHPERWHFLPLPSMSEEKIFKLRSICSKYVGQPYAYKDVIKRFGLKKKANEPDTWWCSEICTHVINSLGVLPRVSEVLSPTAMYKKFACLLK